VMDGKEAVRQIRKFDKSVPILALTALTDPKDVQEILDSGVSNYTSKPLDKKLFFAQIKAITQMYLRSRSRYNKDAVNLVNKKIFRRKTVFLIDRLEDLFEFWEYILEYNIAKADHIEEVLQCMYRLEEHLVKSGVENEIVLEESLESYYFTIADINEASIDRYLSYCNEAESIVEESGTVTFVVKKRAEEQETEPEETEQDERQPTPSASRREIDRLKQKLQEAKELEEAYHTYEKISAETLAEELDPTTEDKIEDFQEEIELVREQIYALEDPEADNPKASLQRIADSFRKFNEVVDYLGIFSMINKAFADFIIYMEDVDTFKLSDIQKRILLATLIRGIIDDFERWIIALFVEKDAVDIHYMDRSFVDNTLQVNLLLLEDEKSDSIESDDSIENPFELLYLINCCLFIGSVDRIVEYAEFNHVDTILGQKSCVAGTAGGGICGRHPRHLFDGSRNRLNDFGVPVGHERFGRLVKGEGVIHRLKMAVNERFDGLFCGLGVVADIEHHFQFARGDVGHFHAGANIGDDKPAGVKKRIPFIQIDTGDPGQNLRDGVDRVARLLGVGGVPLPARHFDDTVYGTAPADLDGVAKALLACRLGDDGVIGQKIARFQVAQHLLCAIFGFTLFVAGQQQRECAVKMLCISTRLHKSADAAFHILCAAGVDDLLFYFGNKRVALPPLARRYHIDMAGKAEVRPLARFFVEKEVFNIRSVDPYRFKVGQVVADEIQRSVVIRRHGAK